MERLDVLMDWVAQQYVTALNRIHYMHDKYSYEAALMALHDAEVRRTMACGIAGLSVCADSLSAIKYAKVFAKRDEAGIAKDFEVEGEFPKFGNNDDRVDSIASDLVKRFMSKIEERVTYRDSLPTQSILTITSNVVYGKKTGTTPCGRQAGSPFAPGANPMHGRDEKGAVAPLLSCQTPLRVCKRWHFLYVLHCAGCTRKVRYGPRKQSGKLDGWLFREQRNNGRWTTPQCECVQPRYLDRCDGASLSNTHNSPSAYRAMRYTL